MKPRPPFYAAKGEWATTRSFRKQQLLFRVCLRGCFVHLSVLEAQLTSAAERDEP